MRHFCDHNATTPADPRVLEAMGPWLGLAANASSLHTEGRAARRALEDAREHAAQLLGAEPRDLVFTSSATEANNTVIRNWDGPCAVSAIEHPSVLEPASAVVGCRLLPVDSLGVLVLRALDAALASGVRHVALMAVNNETGAVQPWQEAAARCAAVGASLHIDAVQAAGRIAIAAPTGKGMSLVLSGHKLGGPQGVGLLWLAPETRLKPLLRGGGQERMRRAGTENIAAVVGFGEACRWIHAEREQRCANAARNERAFMAALESSVPTLVLHGPSAAPQRVAGTLSLRVPGLSAERVCIAADMEGVAISVGSACSSGAARPSHVLRAMGKEPEEVVESFRVSLSPTESEPQVVAAAQSLATAIRRLGH